MCCKVFSRLPSFLSPPRIQNAGESLPSSRERREREVAGTEERETENRACLVAWLRQESIETQAGMACLCMLGQGKAVWPGPTCACGQPGVKNYHLSPMHVNCKKVWPNEQPEQVSGPGINEIEMLSCLSLSS